MTGAKQKRDKTKAGRRAINLHRSGKLYQTLEKRSTDKTEGYGNTINAVALRALERYFDLVAVGRQELLRTFTKEMLELFAETFPDIKDLDGLGVYITTLENMASSSVKDSDAARYNQLAAVLRTASPLVLTSLLDAIEHYRIAPEEHGSLYKLLQKAE